MTGRDEWDGAADARRCLSILFEPGAVVELRAPKIPPRSTVFAGYYADMEALVRDARACEKRGAPGVYVTLNPVNPALLARSKNRGRDKPEAATGNSDILCRRWMFVDIDPTRPAGISATEGEHRAAMDRAQRVALEMCNLGWPVPVVVDSGNGAYLLYRIDVPTDDKGLIGRVLVALGAKFDDPAVKVDVTAANSARILKLVGTLAQKGDSLDDRPHRRSAFVSVPEPIALLSTAQLETFAAPAPAVATPSAPALPRRDNAPKNLERFDLAGLLARSGHDFARQEVQWSDGRKWVFRVCPWNETHTDNSAWVAQFNSGKLDAGCSHNSCAGKNWHDLRAILQPGWKPWEPPIERRPAREEPRDDAPEADAEAPDPYSSVPAERAVIAGLLHNPAAADEVQSILPGADLFKSASLGLIYAAALALSERNAPLDRHTLADELERRGSLSIPGAPVMADTAAAFAADKSSAGNVAHHARIVAERAAVRAVREAAVRIVAALDARAPLTGEEAREIGSAEMAKATDRPGATEPVWVFDAVLEEERRLDDPTPPVTYSTGFQQLDQITSGGWAPGNLVILAARPGCGKTSLALQFAASASGERDPGALFVTLEMGVPEITRVAISQRSGVSVSALRRRGLNRTMRKIATDGGRTYERSRLWFDDRPRTLVDILARTRRIRSQYGLGVLVVDYLQLVDVGGGRKNENRTEQVGRLSRALKLLARDLGIVVLALAQFNRAVESREGNKPRLSDLRESGSLEQDADIVMAIHRDTNPTTQKLDDTGKSELIVLKHRAGPTGIIPMHFDGPTQRFNARAMGAS